MSTAYDVELRGIRKSYRDREVVKEFNLQIAQGEFVSFLGPSGCGKTTTLNMISGFVDADNGDLYIKGQHMNGVPPHKRDLGMVFQTYSLFPHMNVFDNVAYGLKMRKTPKAEIARRVREVLELVRLDGVEERAPKQLSGGQRQRVAIARAFVTNPSILLLDEPLSNLDAHLREELRNELARLHKEIGTTTIFVTHDQEEALSLSDRVVVMSNGDIEQIGTPEQIYRSPSTEFVHTFVGKSNQLDGIVEAANGHSAHVRISPDLSVDVARTRADLAPGDLVRMFVRPEAITLSPPPDATLDQLTQAKGVVTRVSFLGAVTEYVIDVAGAQILVRQHHARQPLSPNDTATCHWRNDDALVINTSTKTTTKDTER